MKVYIAGKITGDPNYKAKFAAAAAQLEAQGHTVINPADHPAGLTPRDYMHLSFNGIDASDIVAFLPDFRDSKGAILEFGYCEYTGKPTVRLSTLVDYTFKFASVARDFLREGKVQPA